MINPIGGPRLPRKDSPRRAHPTDAYERDFDGDEPDDEIDASLADDVCDDEDIERGPDDDLHCSRPSGKR